MPRSIHNSNAEVRGGRRERSLIPHFTLEKGICFGHTPSTSKLTNVDLNMSAHATLHVLERVGFRVHCQKIAHVNHCPELGKEVGGQEAGHTPGDHLYSEYPSLGTQSDWDVCDFGDLFSTTHPTHRAPIFVRHLDPQLEVTL